MTTSPTNTTVSTVSQSLSNPNVAAGVAQFLQPVVIDLTALVVNGKQAHWHVRGSNFIGIHELLDEIVEHAQEWADLAAERIVALGLPVDGRLQTVASATANPDFPAGFHTTDETVALMIAQIDAARAGIETAIRELDDIDQSSQDVAIEIARGLDKDRWFLFAHISTQ